MNIYLIGYRCTGKTSAAGLAAESLGLQYADTDSLIEQRAGMHISNYVSRYGWESFRDLEEEIISGLAARTGLAAATGGGAVLREKNVIRMKETGLVIWLAASAETILARMRGDHNTASMRPALTSDPLEQEVRRTLEQRTPLYENACHMKIPTDDEGIEQVCHALLEKIRSHDAWKHFRNPV
ncbi:MAG: shikimate kinase [Desulfobacterales bacterium]